MSRLALPTKQRRMKARAASAIGPVLAVAAMPTAVGSATGRPVHPPRATGAIAHGTPAGAMPFVVALVAHGRAPGQGLQCGATVVAPTVVVTAAHCVANQSADAFDVVAGTVWLSRSGQQRVPVARSRAYPGWVANIDHGDVAVLTLARALPEPAVRLDLSRLRAGTRLTIAGWGLTAGSRQLSDRLLQTTLRVRRDGYCRRYDDVYRTSWDMCASDLPRDACDGDSGGPAFVRARGRLELAGVISWGSAHCPSRHGMPGFYSRLSGIRSWLEQTIAAAQRP